jgi:glycerol-1-phosphate dehydrogenase [NAD(P)+]
MPCDFLEKLNKLYGENYTPMKSKRMQLPRVVLVGSGAIREIGSVCEELNLTDSALVISAPTTYKIAGKDVVSILKENCKVEYHIIEDASMREVNHAYEVAVKRKVNFIVGVGGGKVIDVAKLSSQKAGIDFISVPTAASHDGIASSRASIKSDKGSVSIGAHAPLGVVADTDIIRNSPYRLLASGCGDIVSKYTAVKDWELSHKVTNEEISEYAIALSRMTAKIIMDNCDTIKERTEESVRKVVKALISAGVAMSIAGSSRPGSGSEHKFSHALDLVAPSPALHGEQCGVGSIMMMYLHEDNWESIRDALKKIGAPINARELGIDDKYIIKALLKAREIRPHRYTILEHKTLDRDSAFELAKATGVI